MPRRSPPLLACTLLTLPACAEPGSLGSAGESEASSSASASTDGPVPTTSEPVPTTSEGGGGDSDSATTGVDPSAGSTGDASTGGTTGEAPSPWDGEPLPPEPPGEWTWVPFPDSMCRDGSTTGIGVRYGASDDLVIYFEGGGACFNAATCLLNDLFANFGPVKFDAWALGIGQGGLFNADNPQNPVRDWNMVYVPYCTGDVHAGDRENVGIDGIFGAQQFVGYRNVAAYLERLVPTFADAPHVLVTGISAGGFGAALNYDRIADAWPESKVTLLDDAGPPLSDMYMAPCLQDTWRELYNFAATLPADCDQCFEDDGGGISNLALYLAEKHPDQRLALISAEQDSVIRTFFGYGLNNCQGGLYSGDAFQMGLYELRDEILGDNPIWGSYLMPGIGHTIITGPGFYSTEIAGVPLTDWLSDLLGGAAAHVSP